MSHIFKETIKGKFITLRKVTVADAEDIYRWRASISGQYLHQPEGYSIESQREWILNRPEDEINYIIWDKVKVGMVAVLDLNYDTMIGSVGRLILDEKYLNKGTPYGLEALLLTYKYVFDIGFERITGTILKVNERVYSLQSYLGMEVEGYTDDCYIMTLAYEDFAGYAQKINSLLEKYESR